jgi:O-acetyl-ADP-ribose deacetylase (regulator of RNase III)
MSRAHMKLILTDPDATVVDAWRAQFLKRPEVEIRTDPILDAKASAIILPGANSFGFLDSGVALEASERYGWALEEAIRQRIQAEFDGELLVGQAAVITRADLPWKLVYSPVWRTPRKLGGTIHVFLAVRGALLALRKAMGAAAESVTVALPGFGVTDGGGLDARISARQSRYAYEVVTGLRGPGDKNLTQQMRRERKLMLVPGIDRELEEADGS